MPESLTNSWSGKRFIRTLGLALSLIGLSLYGKVFDPTVTLQMCLRAPEKYDGALIEVGTEATVGDVLADGFTIRQMGKTVRVVGRSEDVAPGEYVNLLAVFHDGPWLELRRLHVAKYRRAKILLSAIPAVGVILLFLYRFRFDIHRFEFSERHHA